MDFDSLRADPGTLEQGFVPVADLPTGRTEELPVVIAEGTDDGPELWVTATIHGDEVNGLAVAHDLLTEALADRIAGRVVCLPTLNPAGVRRHSRTPYYGGGDPNRSFPDDSENHEDIQELIYRQVYDAFAGSADALLDLHTAGLGAFPFNYRHPVLYGERRTESEARQLSAEVKRLMDAFGLPIVNEPEDYTEQSFHRTTTGAAINRAGIPAMTVELGQHTLVNDDVVAAGLAGCYRVLAALEMVDAVPPEIETADPNFESPVDFPVKEADGPWTDTAGIVRDRLDPGEAFEAGDRIADVVDIHGNRRSVVEAEADGYLLNRTHGAAVYENDEIGKRIVRDEREMVQPRKNGE